jgi:hypothetical protein
MRKISHSDRKPKQVKKKGVTVQSVQSTWQADCTGRTVHTDDVAASGDDTWQVMGIQQVIGPVRG